MDSLAAQNTISPAVSGRRTPSFSSSSSSFSSCSSYFHDDSSPLSPATPLRFISGVPFSWEKLPGIPKKLQASKKGGHDESTLNLLLPLPPSTASKRHILPENGNKKIKNHVQCLTRDPFVAALVECSKHGQDEDQEEPSDHHNMWSGGAKVSRSISDRLGFVNLYTSCKNTCAVSESIIYLPRSNRTSHYDLINRGSRQNYYRR